MKAAKHGASYSHALTCPLHLQLISGPPAPLFPAAMPWRLMPLRAMWRARPPSLLWLLLQHSARQPQAAAARTQPSRWRRQAIERQLYWQCSRCQKQEAADEAWCPGLHVSGAWVHPLRTVWRILCVLFTPHGPFRGFCSAGFCRPGARPGARVPRGPSPGEQGQGLTCLQRWPFVPVLCLCATCMAPHAPVAQASAAAGIVLPPCVFPISCVFIAPGSRPLLLQA